MNKQELYSDIKILIDNFCSNYNETVQNNFQHNDISFSDLLNQYKIIIPIIQRDYAQGRNDIDATYIRTDFLKDIKNVIEECGSYLHLDYIYGNINNEKFEPLDGQQRLTTLFLIYLYLYKKAKRDCKCFKNFTYQTRTSAKEFFNVIVDSIEIPDSKDDSLFSKIEDSSWFITQWKQDPTVKACLNMLEEIHKNFNEIENEKIENLEKIKFNLLDMGKLNLYDDLYIKMNSRGRALTDFENLKAQIIQYITINNIDFDFDFSKSIDNEWSEFLWKKIQPKENKEWKKESIDNMHVKLIIISVLITITNFAIKELKISNKNFADFLNKITEAIPSKDKQKTGKIIFDFFKNKKFSELFKDINNFFEKTETDKDQIDAKFEEYKKSTIKYLKKIYDCIKKYDESVTKILNNHPINFEYEVENGYLTNITDLVLFEDFSYKNYMMFLGQIFYLEKINGEIDEKDFISYIRFVRNLINLNYFSKSNGKIKTDAFIRDQRFITPYKEILYYRANNPDNTFDNNSSDDEEKENNSILKNFIDQEEMKSKFIENNSDKEKYIIELENNILLKGNLQFFDLNKINLEEISCAINKCFKPKSNLDDFRFAILAVDNRAYDFEKNRHNCYTYAEDRENVTKYRLYANYADIQWCLSEKSTVKEIFNNFFSKIAEYSDKDNPLMSIIEDYCNATETDKNSWQYKFIEKYKINKLNPHEPYIVINQPDKDQPPIKVSYLRIERPQNREKDFYTIFPDESTN